MSFASTKAILDQEAARCGLPDLSAQAVGLCKTADSKDERTFPISRALTSRALPGAIGALSGGALGLMAAKGSDASPGVTALAGLGGAALGGGAHAGIAHLHRWIQARALAGRLRKDKGLIGAERRLIQEGKRGKGSTKEAKDQAGSPEANEAVAATMAAREAEADVRDQEREAQEEAERSWENQVAKSLVAPAVETPTPAETKEEPSTPNATKLAKIALAGGAATQFGLPRLLGQAVALAGITMGAEAIYNMANRAVRSVSQSNRYRKILEANPDLQQADARKVVDRFRVLDNFGPSIAEDPVVAGHWIRQTLEFPTVTPTVLKDVVDVETKMREAQHPLGGGREVGKGILGHMSRGMSSPGFMGFGE